MTAWPRRHLLGAGAAWLLAPAWAQHGHNATAVTSAASTVPARSGAAPRKRPAALGMGAALGPDGRLWVCHLDGEGRLVLMSSPDQGQLWTQPRVLDLGGDTPAADGEACPKLAIGPQGQMVVVYTQPLSKPYTGAIRLLRSSDGGARFAPPITVHHDRQEITHRFDAVAFDARGALHVAWIDKRDLVLAQAAGRAYEGAAVYRSVSRDGGATFEPETKLADHSCECCRIALAPTADGGVAALWRHVWPVNVRDHGFARLDGPTLAEPVRATRDGWVVAGCPHHGPGLAPARDGGWHAVWFGQRAGVAGVRYGRLDASGAPTGPVRELPDEAAEHACVATFGRQVAIVWRGFDGRAMRWRAWLSNDEGATFTLRELGQTPGESDHPRLAQNGRQVLALWRTLDQGVRVVPLFE